jgi:predicted acetyltransferase
MDEQLVIPNLSFEMEFLAFIEEWKEAGEDIVPDSMDPGGSDYELWLKRSFEMKSAETCPKDLVTADTYFFVGASPRILGAINIRHRLNEYLFNFGGNIGYGIRKSERQKGYAKLMLRLALEKCRELKLPSVLITCKKENVASARTILANGGILENEVPEGPIIKQRYWIRLDG